MRERIDLAFHIMDREYGVTRLLDPEGELSSFHSMENRQSKGKVHVCHYRSFRSFKSLVILTNKTVEFLPKVSSSPPSVDMWDGRNHFYIW